MLSSRIFNVLSHLGGTTGARSPAWVSNARVVSNLGPSFSTASDLANVKTCPRDMSPTEWEEAFKSHCADIRSDLGYEDSAFQLRKILKSGLLRFTDLTQNPERFFHAHRLLAVHSPLLGPGFWIRFTVQYNLFGGTILALASDEQLQVLEDIQESGQLGCFGLTEKLAGVNSGLVVNTTADWDSSKQVFIINSPDVGAYKNWISQGLCADKAVVMADLRLDGKSVGPHAFLMDLRVDGEVVPGVGLGDMGGKTTGNDLDNAWLSFDNIAVPKTALLNRYADIINDQYTLTVQGVKPFEMIGQRLFTGRVAVAQAALEFRKQVFAQTQAYSDNKKCWAPSGEPVLSNIPQLNSLYAEADAKADELTKFVAACERELNACLQAGEMPPNSLIEAIAVAKVRCVETSIDLCFRLKQEVGSYALMIDSGFAHMDFLQCCKFAEGDSRILMQKMARDRLRLFEKQGGEVVDHETQQCAELVAAMHSEIAKSGNKQKAWDDNWEAVYELADTVMDRISEEWRPKFD